MRALGLAVVALALAAAVPLARRLRHVHATRRAYRARRYVTPTRIP